MRNLNIRKRLLAAFFFAAMLVLVLGIMSAYTIWILNSNLRTSSKELKTNVASELDSMQAQNAISGEASAILAASSSDKLREFDPTATLSQLKQGGGQIDGNMESNLTDLYQAKLNYLSTRESLDSSMADFMSQSESLEELVGNSVETVRKNTIDGATKRQQQISDKTDTATRSTLGQLNKTATTTLEDTVLVLQLRGKVLELEVAVDAYLRNPAKEKVDNISKILKAIGDSFGKIPENVAGAFEVSEMNGLRGKAEDLLVGKNGIVNQPAPTPDSVAKIQSTLTDLDAKLIDLADNTVFDGSNNLSNYLQQVTKELGDSLGTLIKTQKDANASLAEVSQLQQSTVAIKENLYKLMFLVQNESPNSLVTCWR
jgi:hypothetical protein